MFFLTQLFEHPLFSHINQKSSMQKKYSWLFLFVLLWSACSKEPTPPDIPGDPVFTAQFQFDAGEQTLSAGLDSLYLFTTYRNAPGAVLVLSGAFAPVDCPESDCPGSLTFELRNDRTGTTVSPDTVFGVGSRVYYDAAPQATDSIVRITFATPDTLEYQLFQWEIDNGSPFTGKSITKEFPDNTPHVVTLRGFRNGALKSVVTRTIVPNSPQTVYPAVGITVFDSSATGPYLLIANTFGSPAISFDWNTGDTTQQIEAGQLNASYGVTTRNLAGNTAFAQVTLSPGTSPGKTADFNFSVQNITSQPDTLQPGSVTIRWVDENGAVWVSQLGRQTPDAYFQILSTDPYELNENGQKTRKMNVSFSCMLFNSDNPLVGRPITGTAVIAVAYP